MDGQTPPVLIDTTSSAFKTRIFLYTLDNGNVKFEAISSNPSLGPALGELETNIIFSFEANVEYFIVVVRSVEWGR